MSTSRFSIAFLLNAVDNDPDLLPSPATSFTPVLSTTTTTTNTTGNSRLSAFSPPQKISQQSTSSSPLDILMSTRDSSSSLSSAATTIVVESPPSLSPILSPALSSSSSGRKFSYPTNDHLSPQQQHQFLQRHFSTVAANNNNNNSSSATSQQSLPASSSTDASFSNPLDFLAQASLSRNSLEDTLEIDESFSSSVGKKKKDSFTPGSIRILPGPSGAVKLQLHDGTIATGTLPSTLSKLVAMKCKNRECNNLCGQINKPRSIYCSKRCQSREQNLRQGRIKNVKRKAVAIAEDSASLFDMTDNAFSSGIGDGGSSSSSSSSNNNETLERSSKKQRFFESQQSSSSSSSSSRNSFPVSSSLFVN